MSGDIPCFFVLRRWLYKHYDDNNNNYNNRRFLIFLPLAIYVNYCTMLIRLMILYPETNFFYSFWLRFLIRLNAYPETTITTCTPPVTLRPGIWTVLSVSIQKLHSGYVIITIIIFALARLTRKIDKIYCTVDPIRSYAGAFESSPQPKTKKKCFFFKFFI